MLLVFPKSRSVPVWQYYLTKEEAVPKAIANTPFVRSL